MASSKKNGNNVADKDDHDEVLIEPIHIDSESLKRAVEEKARLQSQDSGTNSDRSKKANNSKVGIKSMSNLMIF
jgi:hypothetical protein